MDLAVKYSSQEPAHWVHTKVIHRKQSQGLMDLAVKYSSQEPAHRVHTKVITDYSPRASWILLSSTVLRNQLTGYIPR